MPRAITAAAPHRSGMKLVSPTHTVDCPRQLETLGVSGRRSDTIVDLPHLVADSAHTSPGVGTRVDRSAVLHPNPSKSRRERAECSAGAAGGTEGGASSPRRSSASWVGETTVRLLGPVRSRYVLLRLVTFTG